MLVLRRKPGESLLIGENIYVKIVSIEGDKVKVAIDAPKEVSIIRNELSQAVKINSEAVEKVSKNSITKLKKILMNGINSK